MEDFDPKEQEYFTGPDSIHRAYPFRMTARDMARFGLLYLRRGRWRDAQLVPAQWVQESTTAIPWRRQRKDSTVATATYGGLP